MMGLDLEALRAWVEASCALQGVAVFVADPLIVVQVGNLVGAGVPAVAPTGASGQPASQVPDGSDSVGVEQSTLFDRGVDGRIIQNGSNDGRLALEVHRRPKLA